MRNVKYRLSHKQDDRHKIRVTSETAKPPVDEASELRQEIIQLRLQIKDLTDQNKQQERQLERLKALIASMSEVFTMRE